MRPPDDPDTPRPPRPALLQQIRSASWTNICPPRHQILGREGQAVHGVQGGYGTGTAVPVPRGDSGTVRVHAVFGGAVGYRRVGTGAPVYSRDRDHFRAGVESGTEAEESADVDEL